MRTRDLTTLAVTSFNDLRLILFFFCLFATLRFVTIYLLRYVLFTSQHRQNQEQCFEPPSNHFMGLFNFEAPWPIQCTLCAVDGEEACFGQPCWCAPEGGSSGCCPDPGERPLYYEFQVADAFRANKLTLSNDTKFTPEGCEPWDINVEVTFPGATKCDAFPLVDNPDAVCAFIYPEDDQDCGGLDPREYGMQSFESYDAAIAANAVPTHLGGKC
jgi:hypothetical protein